MLLERLSRPVRGVRIVKRGALEHGNPACVQIIPMRQLNKRDVERLLSHLDGNKELLVTSALSPREREAFLDVGFVEREALHLLRHQLQSVHQPPSNPRLKMRPGRRFDLNRVLSIDQQSFDHFWAMDKESLTAARKATPVHRYTVATIDNSVVGYAVTGRSGTASFLQRLGVDPEYRRNGIGSTLVADALKWAKNNASASMLVNTQDRNEQALQLYQHLGFELLTEKLKVLEWPRANATTTA